MKKTVLLLAVCLMLGLCACGLRGQSVARNTVEPVHFSAPAVRQDAAPAEEPRGTLPQGASLLTEQKMKGIAVMYVGEDLDVLLELCDRIVVLCGGQVSGVVDARTADKRQIGALMTRMEGGKTDE